MLQRFLFFVTLCCSTLAFSQNNITINGKVLEKNTQVPLESATVYLTSVADSTMIDYTITDKSGNFSIKTRKFDKPLELKVSFVGFQTLVKPLKNITEDQDFGVLYLTDNANVLGEVTIKTEAPPIRVKKDTLEFNAASFKLRPDSNVETLLKQLPGVEVSPEGKITVNGKEVNQVLVNGKPFFDSDGKIALQSLPSDIINKVQISDTKTKKEELTKQTASSDKASINLTIDEDKNKGLFGKFMGGYGSDKRYESSALVNYFKNKRKISVLASSNNINSTGFSMDEVFDNMGGGRNVAYYFNRDGSYGIGSLRFGGNKGIVQSNMFGANYADEWFKDFGSNVSYLFSNSHTRNTNRTQQVSLLPTGNLNTTSQAQTTDDRYGHNASMNFEYKLDSTAVFFISPKFTKAHSRYSNISAQNSKDENGLLLNDNDSRYEEENDVTNFGNSINFNKAFKKKGRYLNLMFGNENNQEKTNTKNQSVSRFYQSAVADDIRNQVLNNREVKDVYESEIEYGEPLRDSTAIIFGVYWRREKSIQDRKAFDFDTTTQSYTDDNPELTYYLFSNIKMITPKSGFSIQKKKFDLSFTGGTTIVQQDNFSDYLSNTVTLNKNYLFPYASAYGSFRFEKSKSIWMNYQFNGEMPAASQLLPVENRADPLNTYLGNPNVGLIKSHSIYTRFSDYDYATRSGYNLFYSGDFYENQIVASTVYDASGKRTTTYENIKGNYEAWFGGNWNKSYKKEAHVFKIGIGCHAGFNKTKGFTNNETFTAKGWEITPRLNFTYEYGELFTLNPTYNVTFDHTEYSNYVISATSNTLHKFNLQTTAYWPKNWVFGNDFGYTYNSRIADGFKKDFYLWNTSLAYNFYKKKFTAKVKVYDLLNQNQSNSRTITPTMIRDEENIVLKRYVMFSLTYKIEKFAGKEKPSRGSRFMMH